MYKAWQKGISPKEFRKCFINDINWMVAIEQADERKAERQDKINELMAKMR